MRTCGRRKKAVGLGPLTTASSKSVAGISFFLVKVLKHYLAVLVPREGGGWRAHFPDFPGCRAGGSTLEGAVMAASAAATEQVQRLRDQGDSAPCAQSYEEIRESAFDDLSKRLLQQNRHKADMTQLVI